MGVTFQTSDHNDFCNLSWQSLYTLKHLLLAIICISTLTQVKKHSWMTYFLALPQLSLGWLCLPRSSFIKHWKSWHVKGKYIKLPKATLLSHRTLTDTSCQPTPSWCHYLELITNSMLALLLIFFETQFCNKKVAVYNTDNWYDSCCSLKRVIFKFQV